MGCRVWSVGFGVVGLGVLGVRFVAVREAWAEERRGFRSIIRLVPMGFRI